MQIILNARMPVGFVSCEPMTFTGPERTAIRIAGWKASRDGKDARLARAMAAIATGKVETVSCGAEAFEAIKAALRKADEE